MRTSPAALILILCTILAEPGCVTSVTPDGGSGTDQATGALDGSRLPADGAVSPADGAVGPADGAAHPGDGATNPADATGGGHDLAMAGACAGKPVMMPGTSTQMIMSGGKSRSYILHVPTGYRPSQPTQLVFAFHGYTDHAQSFADGIGIFPESDKRGFIAVAPQGFGLLPGWNAGTCCGEPQIEKVDDIGLVKDLLTTLRQDFCIDDHHVYAMGFSNGSMFSHRIACELANDFAAVGAVSGGLVYSPCQPAQPISVQHYQGTSDPVVPYHGGGLFGFPDVPTMFADWGKRDVCTGMPLQTYQMGAVTCDTYESCGEGAEVTLCTIQGGQHAWPGAGGTNDIQATPAILDFFGKHAR